MKSGNSPVLEIDSFILNWSCFKSTLEIYKKWHCFPLLAAEINKNESTSLFILLYIYKNMVDASLSLNDNKKLTVWITTQLWISRVSVLSITPFYNIAPKPLLCPDIFFSKKDRLSHTFFFSSACALSIAFLILSFWCFFWARSSSSLSRSLRSLSFAWNK